MNLQIWAKTVQDTPFTDEELVAVRRFVTDALERPQSTEEIVRLNLELRLINHIGITSSGIMVDVLQLKQENEKLKQQISEMAKSYYNLAMENEELQKRIEMGVMT
ncbi:hypothetical protein QFZ77_002415 [Paenibacillus sp. V4I3]|uniref:hypothetical protein n=1 Tax=Paenibacillus sp. V4I3 TaxID=3042305 RepID=UPI0027889607|nr:hypothetical protein [Paenibacillus sp. V4I3]MDQ0873756.1 hypothetical protein [Paenibacillus sp. V4I3]